jgi:hypothetical protein
LLSFAKTDPCCTRWWHMPHKAVAADRGTASRARRAAAKLRRSMAINLRFESNVGAIIISAIIFGLGHLPFAFAIRSQCECSANTLHY